MSEEHLLPSAASAQTRRSGRLGFGFGHRFFFLLAVGLLWTVPAFWNRTFLYGMLVWDALLLLAWVIDFFYLPRPGDLHVQRRWASVPGIGCTSQITIAVTNHSAVPVRCRLQDDLPPALRADRESLTCAVRPHGIAAAPYSVRALQRGDHRIGNVYLRVQSPLEMAERWYVAPLAHAVRIYPNLEAAKRNAIYLLRSRQIELEKRRLRLRGLGREFESLREYQEGDELRDVCWTATARRGKLVTKVYTVERSQPVWIVLDSGRLLRARVGQLSKLDYAADAALCLAQLALYSGDRVGFLGYGRSIKHRAMLGRGAAQLRQIVEQLALIQTETPEADHLRAAGTLLGMQKRRSLIVWVTDLAETAMTPEVIDAASQMLRRNLLLFVVIGEPELGKKAASRPDSALEMYEMVAAQEMVQRREALLARLREHGALAMEVAPSHLSATLLNQYLMIKDRSLL